MSGSIAFDRAADFYDQTRGFPPGDDALVAGMIVQAGGLAANSTLLEIGIGTGRVALPLASRVGYIVGVDLAQPMMQRLLAKQTTERIGLAQGDATRLPLASAAFDAVLAVHVFHLIPLWREALAEVVRVLKPGGVLLNSWSENFHRESWWDAWNEALPQHRRDAGVSFGHSATFLDESGWQPASEVLSHGYTQQRTPNQFLEGLRARLWSSTWKLSEAELETGIAAVRAFMQTEHTDLDETLGITTTVYVRAYLPPHGK